jgi:hypothetical protein
MVIGALDSPLRLCLERDLATDLYSYSTLIPRYDETSRRVNRVSSNNSMTSLSTAIGALGSHLGPHLEIDLVTDL